jgi:hypothetical protein
VSAEVAAEEPAPGRSFGAVVVVAAIRGILAGAFLAAIPVLFLTATYGTAVLLAAVGAMLGSAALAVGDDVSARLASPAARAVRFLGGVSAAVLAAGPYFSLLGPATGASPARLVAGLAWVGVSLGLGQAAAGSPVYRGYRGDGCARAVISAFVAGGAFGLVFGIVDWPPGSGGERFFLPAVGAFMVAGVVLGLLAVAELNLEPVALRIARWLEPDLVHTALLRPLAASREELAAALRLLEEARRGGDPSLRERALGHTRAALAAEQARGGDELPRGTTAQLLVEILLELGRFEEVETLLGSFPLARPIRAEIARRRGDLASAIALASPGKMALTGNEDLLQCSILASYRAVLALAEADRGDEAAAREHLARAREIPITVERALDGLTVPAVEAALARRRS